MYTAQYLCSTPPCSTPGYTTVLHHGEKEGGLIASWCHRRVVVPWALSFRFTLGGGTFDTRDPLSLLTFDGPDRLRFPDRPRCRTNRSDVRRATRLLAALGPS